MTSQSISVDPGAAPGQDAALSLTDVRVWRWHAASGSRKPIIDGISGEVELKAFAVGLGLALFTTLIAVIALRVRLGSDR